MGSEMCIRDSPETDDCAVRDIRARSSPARRAAKPARHVGQPRSCLLYTSDAADERSSVDLGGRRLIKKKNEERLSP